MELKGSQMRARTWMVDKRSLTNLGYCLKVNERLSAMSPGSAVARSNFSLSSKLSSSLKTKTGNLNKQHHKNITVSLIRVLLEILSLLRASLLSHRQGKPSSSALATSRTCNGGSPTFPGHQCPFLPSHYAFSSPSSPSSPTLVVDRPSGDLRLHDGKLLGSKRVSSIAGILGMIKLRLGIVTQ